MVADKVAGLLAILRQSADAAHVLRPILSLSFGILLFACSDPECDVECGDAGAGDDGGSDAVTGDVRVADAAVRDSGPRPDVPFVEPVFVYGHTRSGLYELNPRDSSLRFVGDFDCVEAGDNISDSAAGMTDLAVDRDGAMFGVGRASPDDRFHVLMRVTPATGACSLVGGVMLDGDPATVQGLSFVPAGTLDATQEVLVGSNGAGAFFRIDRETGVASSLGTIDVESDIRGGDIVSIAGAASWVITSANSLVEFDLVSGDVVSERPIVGAPASDSLGWGLGYWGGSIYAFSFLGKLYAIDTESAVLSEIAIPDAPAELSFRGAAVTTIVPLI
ncbi:MAG: hypothetical protein ACI9KE_005922 [Polyangiales bacterium]